MREPGEDLIYSTRSFWIIIAFLIYLAGTFFLYLFSQDMLNDKLFMKQYQVINTSFIVLRNILFSVAIFIKDYEKNKPTEIPEEVLSPDWKDV